MSDKRWKQIERWWASILGGVRIPVTGRHSADVPDIAHPYWAIEVKYSNTPPARILKGLEQAKRAAEARSSDLMPILCQSYHVKGERDLRHLVTMEVDDWLKIAKLWEREHKPVYGWKDEGKDIKL